MERITSTYGKNYFHCMGRYSSTAWEELLPLYGKSSFLV
jgi:hypothetical protein